MYSYITSKKIVSKLITHIANQKNNLQILYIFRDTLHYANTKIFLMVIHFNFIERRIKQIQTKTIGDIFSSWDSTSRLKTLPPGK